MSPDSKNPLQGSDRSLFVFTYFSKILIDFRRDSKRKKHKYFQKKYNGLDEDKNWSEILEKH